MRSRAVALVVGVAALTLLTALVPAGASTHVASTTPRGAAVESPSTDGSVPMRPAVPANPMASSGIGRLFVTTSDPAVVPNDGIRTNLTAFAPRTFPQFTSYQEGVEETIGSYDAVFGIFENYQSPPVPFFTVFSNATDQTVHLAYWSTESLLTGSSYDFLLTHGNGTLWTLAVNGALFGGNATAGSFDFQATEATWAGGISFSEISLYTNVTSAPPSAPASDVFAMHEASGWYLPTSGIATFSGPAPWGIEGRVQHPTLAPGAMTSGTSLPAVPNGTVLWSGGPVSVRVQITVPSSAIGLSDLPVAAVVTDTGGAPLPGVAVYLSDDHGGSVTPATSTTNATGGVFGAWSTPNATSNETDVVTALVTTFGYRGFASQGVPVTPPLHVRIALDSGGSVPPGGSGAFTLRTTDVSGQPVASIFLSFTVAGGQVAPGDAVTGSDGRTTVTISTTASGGSVVLTAVATGAGVWGSTSVAIPVRAAPTTPWGLYAGAVVAVALVVVGVVLWRRPRKPKPTAEEIWGPSLRPANPSTSRTPPGPGVP